jgi:choline kinase
MRAIILAAGRGSRMNELTSDRPKCLVSLNGRSLLSLQIKALREAGIKNIGIVTGYKREMLAELGDAEFHNSNWERTQMVSSLAHASEWLEQSPCIVSYSDIFYDKSAILSLLESTASIAITYDPHWLTLWKKRFSDPLLDAETFQISESGVLIEIGNKPTSVKKIQGQYMGLLRFTPEGWREMTWVINQLPQSECNSLHMTGALQKIIKAGRLPIKAIPYEGVWGEVDSPEDLKSYNNNQ